MASILKRLRAILAPAPVQDAATGIGNIVGHAYIASTEPVLYLTPEGTADPYMPCNLTMAEWRAFVGNPDTYHPGFVRRVTIASARIMAAKAEADPRIRLRLFAVPVVKGSAEDCEGREIAREKARAARGIDALRAGTTTADMTLIEAAMLRDSVTPDDVRHEVAVHAFIEAQTPVAGTFDTVHDVIDREWNAALESRDAEVRDMAFAALMESNESAF